MKNKFINISKRITKGIQKGWSVPTLPVSIANFHNQPITRIFRIIGGLSILITLGRISLNINDIPNYILYAFNFISILFFIYMFAINVLRLIHIIKVLGTNELDVRNSPLDRLASLTARVIFCAKGLCYVGAGTGSAVGSGLALDAALVNTGHDPVFSPVFVSFLKTILPEGVIKKSDVNMTGSEIKKLIKNLDESQADQVGLSDIGKTIQGSPSLSELEKTELEEIVNKEKLNIQAKEAYLKTKIKEELDKLKK